MLNKQVFIIPRNDIPGYNIPKNMILENIISNLETNAPL